MQGLIYYNDIMLMKFKTNPNTIGDTCDTTFVTNRKLKEQSWKNPYTSRH